MKNLVKTALFSLILIGSMTNCSQMYGEEVGRLLITGQPTETVDSQQLFLELEQGDQINFWTVLDLKADADVYVEIQVFVRKDGEIKENFQFSDMEADFSATTKNAISKNYVKEYYHSGFTVNQEGSYQIEVEFIRTQGFTGYLKRAELGIYKKAADEA